MNHVHFIGIGGVGMSGLAQILRARSIRVSGSDPYTNAATERLAAQGATLYTEQIGANIACEKPDLVVATAAIHDDNLELRAAQEAGIPVVSRADFLGRLMADFGGPRIAISGTHGKTTTTAMAAEVLLAGGLDPTVLVGGEYAGIGGNVKVGQSDVFLTEACEAYDSFLALHPDISVITNIEADHLDHYGTEAGVFKAFQEFLGQTASDGCIIWCAEDDGARRLMEMLGEKVGGPRQVACGFAPFGVGDCLWATDIDAAGSGSVFTVQGRSGGKLWQGEGRVHLKVPGRHNVLNALAAAALGQETGLSFEVVRQGLEAFTGTGRRFETLGETDDVRVIDDYAHHPTEIRATLAAARSSYPDRRVIAVFQPHLYSRTRDFMDGFAHSLAEADAILLTDIYPAREEPIPGIHVVELTKRIAEVAPTKTLLYLPIKRDLVGALDWVTKPGDLVLVMGAGDIREVGEAFVSRNSVQRPLSSQKTENDNKYESRGDRP